MSKLKFSLIFQFIVIMLTLSMKGFCERAAGDSGIPDSVKFEAMDYYLYGPPYQGKLKVPIFFFHDEGLAGITAPFIWSCQAVLDSVSFAGNRVEADVETATYDSVNRKVLLTIAVITQDTIPSGRGLLSTLYFSISDTGYLEIDSTFFPPSGVLEFHGVYAMSWPPQFVKLQLHLTLTESGDANQDGYVTIADAVFMVNYLFRNGPVPSCSNCADVNCNCEVNVLDVVYLINYLFRSGNPPQFGCVLPL